MVVQKVKINGIWQTVTGGISSGNSGITKEKEIYIGEEDPTDENVVLWIDTNEEEGEGASLEVIDNLESTNASAALSANQGRVLKEMIADGYARIYVVPQGVLNRNMGSLDPYILTEEEKADFLAQGDFSNTIVVADITLETGYQMRIPMRFIYVDGTVTAIGENFSFTLSSGEMEQIHVTVWEVVIGDELTGRGIISGATSIHSSGTIKL